MPNSSSKAQVKVITVGEFYFIHDGSQTGHPGFILSKDDENNRYLVARFDSDKYSDKKTKIERGVRHITKLIKPTNQNVKNSYVHNRPMICKRKDIGIKLFDLSLSDEDIVLISKIANANPEYSPSLRKKPHRLAYSALSTGCGNNIKR